MDKNEKQPANNDLDANNKKQAFKEGEMDNSGKLNDQTDAKERVMPGVKMADLPDDENRA